MKFITTKLVISSLGYTFLVHSYFLGPQVPVAWLLAHPTYIPARVWLKVTLRWWLSQHWHHSRPVISVDVAYGSICFFSGHAILQCLTDIRHSVNALEWPNEWGKKKENKKKHCLLSTVSVWKTVNVKVVKAGSKSKSKSLTCGHLARFHAHVLFWMVKEYLLFVPPAGW